MIELPKRVNYAEAFLTFRCPLKCGYCINKSDGTLTARDELPAGDWADGLNRINFGDVPITLGGGEPTMHPGFFWLLDNLKPQTNVDLLTNLQFDIGEFVRRTSPDRFTPRNFNNLSAYRSIRASFHPQLMDMHDTVERALQLQDVGFNVGIFALNHPLNLEANVEMSELAREEQVYFFIKDFLGEFDGHTFGYYRYPKALDGVKKQALCRTKDLLLGPDGEAYRCHRDLYHGEHSIGHILGEMKLHDNYRPCDNYGTCNPCDVKQRANRFLQMGDCNVEIEEDVEVEIC